MGTNVEKDFKRGALAVLTSGTSEIKTGAGEYHDETIADAIFPKTINNMMLDDREKARKGVDTKKAADTNLAKPGPQPDATDKTLAATRRAAAARLLAGAGRKNSFIGGL